MNGPGLRDEEGTHTAAADAFVERALNRFNADIESLYVFGSAARDEARGLSSDVDVLIVLEDEAAQDTTADALRDLAYDVMLEYGPVVELHILSKSAFVESRYRANPFLETVVREGRAHACTPPVRTPVEETTVSLTHDGDWYVAKDEETGVTSQGRTRSDALANISEALELYDDPVSDDVDPGVPDAPWFESSG